MQFDTEKVGQRYCKLILGALMVGNEEMKRSEECSIELFSLPVCLWEICGGVRILNSEYTA